MLLGYLGYARRTHKCTRNGWVGAGMWWVQDSEKYGSEKRGHWVGFADNQGDHLTWKILTDDTNTIIIRSAVRSATKTSPNLRLDPPKGEDQPQDLTSDVFVYGRSNLMLGEKEGYHF